MRRARIGLGLAVLLAACTTGPNPSATATPMAQPTAEPSPMTSPSDAGDGAVGLGPPGQVLEPGRYTRDDFQPRVTFEVAEGWTAQQVAPGFFDVQQAVGTLDVIAVQFARPLAFADSATSTVQTASAADAVAAMQANSDLTVSAPDGMAVDGLAGIRVLIETTDPVDTQPPILRPVLTVASGPISIASGRRLQVTLIEIPDGLLAILVGGSVANWSATLTQAMPVIASVQIDE